MASGTRSGKQPASAEPEDGNQQLAIRAFSPEQESSLNKRLDDISANIEAKIDAKIDAKFDEILRILRQQQISPVLPSIETSPPAPPTAPPAPPPAPPAPPPLTSIWNPQKKLLRAEDVGFFDPEFQAEQEHGKSTPGPVVNAGKHAYYLDVFVFVDRLNELTRKHGENLVKDVIPSCLRGSALTWWTTEVDDSRKEVLEASTTQLQQWTDILIKYFRINPAKALSALARSRYTLRDLHQGMSPRIWIHSQLSLARSADLGSIYNQLTMIWNQMAPYFQEQLAQPSPTTKLSDFLADVDAKTTAWQNRAYELHRQQIRGAQPQDRPQNPYRDAHPSAQHGSTQAPSQAEPHRRSVHFEHRPRLYRGKENGKAAYSYMIDTLPDGTPRYADEDPDDPLEHSDDYADHG